MQLFSILEHDALRAGWHHDLRLERDGVLKSWVVPKGLPEDPGVRRAARQVNDHDLLYAVLEGDIPEGQPGAGKISIWDLGMYETKFWSDIKIEVTFHGKRLCGEYVLRWIEKMECWLLWKRQRQKVT